MARFKFSATIIVEREDIKKEHDAINELQIMLNDYEDMNSDSDSSITINWSKIIKISDDVRAIVEIEEESEDNGREMPWDYSKHFE